MNEPILDLLSATTPDTYNALIQSATTAEQLRQSLAAVYAQLPTVTRINTQLSAPVPDGLFAFSDYDMVPELFPKFNEGPWILFGMVIRPASPGYDKTQPTLQTLRLAPLSLLTMASQVRSKYDHMQRS